MSQFDDFFTAKPAVQTQQPLQVTEFRPNPKKGQNGVFEGIVRFLPNPNDPANKSIISKYIVYLTDPASQTSMNVDCPSTVGQPDIIQNTFFALRNSTNTVLQENSKKFSRKQKFASLVQVLDCKSDPSLVNKVLVWVYGTKVHDKLNSEMNPPMGEGRNPFNLIYGRPFSVQVKEVSGYPNYDSCQFFDLDISRSGMRIVDPTSGQVSVVTADTIATEQGRAMVVNYLKEVAPDTTKYEYHEWNAETQAFVNKCIQIYSDPQKTVQAMSAAQNPGMTLIQSSTAPAAPNTAAFTGPASAPQMPLGEQFSMPTAPAAPVQAPSMPTMGFTVAQAAPVTPGGFQAPELGADINALLGGAQPTEKKSAPSMGMNLNDVLNGQML